MKHRESKTKAEREGERETTKEERHGRKKRLKSKHRESQTKEEREGEREAARKRTQMTHKAEQPSINLAHRCHPTQRFPTAARESPPGLDPL